MTTTPTPGDGTTPQPLDPSAVRIMPTPYVFFRDGFFYVIEMPADMLEKHGEAKCIADNAKCNPGTLKVEGINGRTVWQMEEAQ